MPNISTFMYCSETSTSGSDLQISNPLQVINTLFIPSTFSFAIVFGINNMDLSEKKYILQVKFYGPESSDNILLDTGSINLDKQAEVKTTPLPKEARGMMINLDFRNVVFQNEGTYRTEVYLNEELLGQYPIYVIGGE